MFFVFLFFTFIFYLLLLLFLFFSGHPFGLNAGSDFPASRNTAERGPGPRWQEGERGQSQGCGGWALAATRRGPREESVCRCQRRRPGSGRWASGRAVSGSSEGCPPHSQQGCVPKGSPAAPPALLPSRLLPGGTRGLPTVPQVGPLGLAQSRWLARVAAPKLAAAWGVGGGSVIHPPPHPDEGRGRMGEAGQPPWASCGGLCPFPQQGLCGQCPGAGAWS